MRTFTGYIKWYYCTWLPDSPLPGSIWLYGKNNRSLWLKWHVESRNVSSPGEALTSRDHRLTKGIGGLSPWGDSSEHSRVFVSLESIECSRYEGMPACSEGEVKVKVRRIRSDMTSPPNPTKQAQSDMFVNSSGASIVLLLSAEV